MKSRRRRLKIARAKNSGGAASAAPERGDPDLIGRAYLFKYSSKLFVKRAQKEIVGDNKSGFENNLS